jgi:O-antigen ligase
MASSDQGLQLRSIGGGRTLAPTPWLLLIFFWVLMFPIYNEIHGPSIPYDETSLSGISHLTETGDPLNRILIVTLGLAGSWLLVRGRGRIRLQPVIATILFTFLAWNALSGLWSTDQSITTRRLASLALMTLFSAGCAVRLNAYLLSIFITCFPVFGIVPGLILEIVNGRFHPLGREYRFDGMAPHPNVLAAYLSVSVIFLSWLCWQARGRVRIWLILATLFVASFLVLTGSRTSVAAMLASIAFSFLLIIVRDHRRLAPVLLAVLGLIITSGVLANTILSTESNNAPLTNAFQRDEDEGSSAQLSGRVELWRSLLPYVIERPWTGYGYGGFWSPQRIEDVSADQGWVIQQGHSGYLDEVLAVGIPGALLYIALLFVCIGSCMIRFIRCQNAYGAWAAVLVFISIHNATESLNIFSSFTNVAFYTFALSLAFTNSGRLSSDPGWKLDISPRD